jgi:membrane-bound ClpP family serine protease
MKIWRSWGWLIAIVVGLVFPSLMVLVLWVDGIGYPGIGLGRLMADVDFTAIALSAFAWIVTFIASVVLLAAKRSSGRNVGAAVLLAFGMVLGLVPSLLFNRIMKLKVAELIADRSAPVVEAIEKYRALKGAPPADLTDLVPAFLPEMPHTGSVLYPDYDYRSGEATAAWNNPWILSVPMTEVLKWDVLYYCPEQRCEGFVEELGAGIPLGKWMLLDE